MANTVIGIDGYPRSLKVRSLKDLSQQAAFQYMMNPKISNADFAALDNRLQYHLFDSFRDEINRHRPIEKNYNFMNAHCPKVDSKIYCSGGPVNDTELWNEDDEESGTLDPYEEVNKATEKWSYLDRDEMPSILQRIANMSSSSSIDEEKKEKNDDNDGEGGGGGGGGGGNNQPENEKQQKQKKPKQRYTEWYSSSDLVFDEKEGKFMVKDRYRAILESGRFTWLPTLSDRISSQLLLYRTTVIFGMPPPEEADRYKCCWTLTLQHSSGDGTLELDEHKGSPGARFFGSKAASDDALDLLNLLAHVRMPHTYDGIVAGTIA